MRTFSNYPELLRAVYFAVAHRPHTVIGIDGFMNSGKTVLATALGYDLSAPIISLDSFVGIRNGSLSYPNRLRRGRLSAAVLRHGKRLIIIEGLCLRSVMRSLGLSLSLDIYVKRISSVGLWHDGLALDDFVAGSSSSVSDDVHEFGQLRYHAYFRPHDKATFALNLAEGEDLRPNNTVNRTRRHMPSLSSPVRRRAGYLQR